MMELYPNTLSTGALTRDDTRRIAQALHFCARNPQLAQVAVEDMLLFLEQVIQDIKKGNLPPHPYAFVHILGLYKECKKFDDGHKVWRWLVQQDDNFVSQAVYGAAIELLAFGRILRLPELEAIYNDALKRFPGTFAEYHLSPDAIVPNRDQPTLIADLPITLLQGILTARLLNNDWKNSYLALDTALRLYPAQLPARFFELFMISRQLGEAYTVFLIACRAGNVPKPNHLTALISRIMKSIEVCSTLRDRMVLLRAIANAIYANLQAGGSLEPIHVGQLITSFGSLLPEPSPETDFQGDMAVFRNRIVTFAHGGLSSLLQAGMPPSSHAFIALINLAGRLRVPDLLRVSLQDTETAQVDIGDFGARTVLTSAGQTGAKDLIEAYWQRIVHNAASNGRQIHWKDWMSLSKACQQANHVDYFRAQLSEQEHAIPAQRKDVILESLSEWAPYPERGIATMTSEGFENELSALNKQLKNISAVVMSGQRLDMRMSPFYMSFDPNRPPLGKPEDMQKVYNEYTIDPHQPPLKHSAAPAALSPTGIPLGDLRFANWVSVAELTDQASTFEQERLDEIKRTGSHTARIGAKNPLELKPTGPLALHALRAHIKTLRNESVGQPRFKLSGTQLNFRRIPVGPQQSTDATAETLPSQPQSPSLRTTYHRGAQTYQTYHRPDTDTSKDARVPNSESPKTRAPTPPTNSLKILYHGMPERGGVPEPASTTVSAGADASSSDGRPPRFRSPSIRYYVGMKSDHEAPIPQISHRPLGNRKHDTHHSLRKNDGTLNENEDEAPPLPRLSPRPLGIPKLDTDLEAAQKEIWKNIHEEARAKVEAEIGRLIGGGDVDKGGAS